MLDHEVSTPDWIRRFTAPSLGFPDWIQASPDRLTMIGNLEGSRQVWAHDRSDGAWRQLSDEPIGVESVWMLPDGRVAWWRDVTGDERGSLVAAAFAGGTSVPVFPEIPEGWLTGLSFEAGRSALSVEVDGTYRVFVVEADGTTREIASFSNAAGVGNTDPGAGGGLSADGSLLCIWHSEHGDILHASLRVFEVATGAAVGELEDEGRSLQPGGGRTTRGSSCVTSSRVGRSCSGSTWSPARARR
jgi:hypothetical protein